MMRHYRPSKRSRLSRRTNKLLPSIMLVLVGSAGFYLAMQWFRGDAEERPVMAQEVEEVSNTAAEVEEVVPIVPAIDNQFLKTEESSAPLVSAFDGQHTGRIQRYITKNSAEMIVLAYLPPLDMAADSYHVWLLKDGLADVKDMGQLAPRADGSWVLNFTAGPSTGIVDPKLYKTAVIMREPNDDNPAPSGNRIAEAKF
jgi:hypothetical protein